MRACGQCAVEPIAKRFDPTMLEEAKAACLTISGMGCQHCATSVRNSLLSIDGVHIAEIAVQEGLGVVAYDEKKVQPVDLVKAVAAAGGDGRHQYWATINEIVSAEKAISMGHRRD